MAMSISVNLPRKHSARFPDRCILCGQKSPGAVMRVLTSTIGWWTVLFWMWGWPFIARPPACPRCARKLHLRRAGRVLVMTATIIIAILFVWPMFEDSVSRLGRKWVAMLIAIACLIPQIVLAVIFPPPFEVSAYKESVDYDFADADYAYDFADENSDAAGVKIDGDKV